MWIVKILEHLIQTSEVSEKEQLTKFINHLFKVMKDAFYGEDEPELYLAVGLISGLYNLRETSKVRDVTSIEYAQSIMGLLVLLEKSANEETTYCSDFNFLLDNSIIAYSVDFNPEEVPPLNFIKDIEKETFQKLDYTLPDDFVRFTEVLTALRLEIGDKEDIIIGLHKTISSYDQTTPEFKQFASDVNAITYRYSKQFQIIHQNKLEFKYGTPSTLLLFDNRLQKPTPQPPNAPSNLLPAVQSIYEQLEDYAFVDLVNYSIVQKFRKRFHRDEVADITKRIELGELTTVDLILQQLERIDIKDERDILYDIIACIKAGIQNSILDYIIENLADCCPNITINP